MVAAGAHCNATHEAAGCLHKCESAQACYGVRRELLQTERELEGAVLVPRCRVRHKIVLSQSTKQSALHCASPALDGTPARRCCPILRQGRCGAPAADSAVPECRWDSSGGCRAQALQSRGGQGEGELKELKHIASSQSCYIQSVVCRTRYRRGSRKPAAHSLTDSDSANRHGEAQARALTHEVGSLRAAVGRLQLHGSRAEERVAWLEAQLRAHRVSIVLDRVYAFCALAGKAEPGKRAHCTGGGVTWQAGAARTA